MGLVFLTGRDTFRYTCTEGSRALYSDLESIKRNGIKTLHLRLGHSTDVKKQSNLSDYVHGQDRSHRGPESRERW